MEFSVLTVGPNSPVLSHVWLFVTLQTVAHQAPLSMGFSRQAYWNGLPPDPSPPGISSRGSSLPREQTHVSFISCKDFAGGFFTTAQSGKPVDYLVYFKTYLFIYLWPHCTACKISVANQGFFWALGRETPSSKHWTTRKSLIIYFIYSSVYMLTPNS